MDALSGELSAAAKPTQEQYELSVEVSDGGTPPMTSLVSVVILVEPELTLTNLPATIDVTEDAAVGTVVFSTGTSCSFTTLEVRSCPWLLSCSFEQSLWASGWR